jgi:hypothetical protein
VNSLFKKHFSSQHLFVLYACDCVDNIKLEICVMMMMTVCKAGKAACRSHATSDDFRNKTPTSLEESSLVATSFSLSHDC